MADKTISEINTSNNLPSPTGNEVVVAYDPDNPSASVGIVLSALPVSSPTQTALNGKANTSHTHAIADVTDLQSTLDGKVDAAALGAAIDDLIDGAPTELNTLNELAAAIGDDPNYSTTVTNALAGKANTTHTHVAADVTDFDTAVAANSAVAANTAKISFDSASSTKLAGIEAGAEVNVNADWNAVSGDAQILNKPTISGSNTGDVSLAGTPDYITISGQTITRNPIDLATDVTGDLPFANLTQLSAHQVLARAGSGTGNVAGVTMGNDTILGRAGSGDVDDLSATQVRTIINVENGADVTDATNVAAAGAIMDGDFSANGVMTRTASGAYTSRTLTGTTNQVVITNGDGVSGNPTFSLPQNIHTGASPEFAGMRINGADAIRNFNVKGTGVAARISIQGTTTTDQPAIEFTNDGNANRAILRMDSISTTGTALSLFTESVAGSITQRLIIDEDGHTKPATDSTYTLGSPSLYWSNTYTDRLYLNATADFNGSVAGTANLTGNLGIAATSGSAPQALTLGSTAATSGISLYNTVDQNINPERLRIFWNGNTAIVRTDSGGTGTVRSLSIGTLASSLVLVENSSSSGTLQYNRNNGATNGVNVVFSGTFSQSSSVSSVLALTPTINQSGTAGYTAELINITENTTGSGNKRFVEWQIGGSTRGWVNSAGAAYFLDSIQTPKLQNPSSGNNSQILFNTTGSVLSRNIADANAAFTVNQVNASSTGNILNLQSQGVTRAFFDINGDLTVPDEAYGAGWNGSLEVTTKNAVYDITETKVTRVVHGSTAGTARPTATYVEWIGDVEPTNATNNDTWVVTP